MHSCSTIGKSDSVDCYVINEVYTTSGTKKLLQRRGASGVVALAAALGFGQVEGGERVVALKLSH